ncbi:hypothetical protein D3C71_1681570 [compost metagenome]
MVIGNPNAEHEIIKVCNPYCGPCAKAHSDLEAILNENFNVKLRIIFTASDDDKDIKVHPVRHLLAIEATGNENLVKKALDDWYLSPTKDYESFSKKYLMNGELKTQGEKVRAMNKWCKDMKILFTPTIYVNGHLLPQNYNVDELKSFF